LDDPRILDAEDSALKILDLPLKEFADSKNANVQINSKNAPNRRISQRGSDGISRAIVITPTPGNKEKLISGRVWIGAGAWLDEGEARWVHGIPAEPKDREVELADLERKLPTRLEQLWSELLNVNQQNIKTLGRRSEPRKPFMG
jgi:hypothetical protein